jgi:hypothetical protein
MAPNTLPWPTVGDPAVNRPAVLQDEALDLFVAGLNNLTSLGANVTIADGRAFAGRFSTVFTNDAWGNLNQYFERDQQLRSTNLQLALPAPVGFNLGTGALVDTNPTSTLAGTSNFSVNTFGDLTLYRLHAQPPAGAEWDLGYFEHTHGMGWNENSARTFVIGLAATDPAYNSASGVELVGRVTVSQRSSGRITASLITGLTSLNRNFGNEEQVTQISVALTVQETGTPFRTGKFIFRASKSTKLEVGSMTYIDTYNFSSVEVFDADNRLIINIPAQVVEPRIRGLVGIFGDLLQHIDMGLASGSSGNYTGSRFARMNAYLP